ncbi:H-NS family nucleoid-associated regulatory protein [Bradyrhizobium manausense]|uniref:H-NS family nucleoid-associated regulatory protein n=1 Tax=Bradyrhizobium manausense TaxID=989370 RepID=UPI001BAA9A02|nr:H-NS family nucleoid-associated regulatory protein [Bradyrhizobium manausense]MBR0721802.1 H-NS histone family protein [Bradyrhizobium manausense]
MKKQKPFSPPPEHELGRKVILGFMGLGVNDMKYTLEAMHRVYDKARKAHDEMMAHELRRLEVEEQKAAGIRKTRAKPKPTHRSKKDRKLTWTGRGSMPRWMREEMKALKLKPDAFLIK